MAQEQGFFWQRHAEAERLVLKLLEDFTARNGTLQRLAEGLLKQTSSRLFDWVDHLLLQDSRALLWQLADLGYAVAADATSTVTSHPGALLPPIVKVEDIFGAEAGVALRVECLGEFLEANGFSASIEGDPCSGYRRCLLGREGRIALFAVERQGSRSFEPEPLSDEGLRAWLGALELWQSRPRSSDDEGAAWEETLRIVRQIVDQLGCDRAAEVVCRGERHYWLTRNRVGRLQKSRQDRLGVGWANHDHHTFRSSRRNFARLVELFSLLGFHCRERFYAGKEAGWGAQVMENPTAGLSLFLDVDLAPEEVAADFSRAELAERETLGTIGLWCALHGDSIFEAGLHHLAARFDFQRLGADLAACGAEFMAPFSDFTYLKQAFSVAERWQPDPDRVEKLVGEGRISTEQGESFLARGAVGSHLENIERNEGYKGFNKKNVSAIIRQTDPRQQL